MSHYEKMKVFLMGALSVLLLLVFLGATTDRPGAKYQVSAFGMGYGDKGREDGCYVLNTKTGAVRRFIPSYKNTLEEFNKGRAF